MRHVSLVFIVGLVFNLEFAAALATPDRDLVRGQTGNALVEGRLGVQFVAVPQWAPALSARPLHCGDIVVTARLSSGALASSRAFGAINDGSCEYRLMLWVPNGAAEQAQLDWSVPSDRGKAIKSGPIVVEIAAGQTKRADFGALVGLCAHPTKI